VVVERTVVFWAPASKAVGAKYPGGQKECNKIHCPSSYPLSLFDRRYLSDEVVERTVVFWAPASKAVGAKRQRMLGSLVLAEQAVKVDDTQALPVLLKVRVCCVCVGGGLQVCFWGGGCKCVWVEGRRRLAEQAVKVDDSQALPVLVKVWQGNHESWTTSSWLHAAELATPCLTPEQ
jgi:hypothetical protein